jgi:phage-related protein (TIGR01555 family)
MNFDRAFQNVLGMVHGLRGHFGNAEPNLLAGTPGAPDALAPQEGERTDGWVNSNTGFGTSRDKSQGTYWLEPYGLTDPELTALYNFHDLAAKVVDIPVRESFRAGFCFTGLDDAGKLSLVEDYLRGFELMQRSREAAVWGRLYGGAAEWLKTDAGDPALPFRDGENVEAIHVIDRRFLWPFRWYTQGPKAGTPETFRAAVMTGGGQMLVVGELHESRLVLWPGVLTEMQEKRRRQNWDMSVLQRPYEALADSGTVWKAIQILTVDANQAIFKIKNFWRMIAADPSQQQDSQVGGGPTGGILNRIRFMDLMRSVSRAIVLDKEDEEFERKPTSFAGLPELSERQWTRVSAAADIPLPLLTGEYPSGLQSTGEGPFRVFYALCVALQDQEYGPRILRAAKKLLASKSSPVQLSKEELAQLQIKWNPIWAPTAGELGEIRLKRAQEADIWVNNIQGVTAEAAALSMPEEWYSALDRDALEQRVEDLKNAPPEDDAAAKLQFAPTDLAAFVSVNSALASVGLAPIAEPEGSMTVAAFKAKGEADAAPPAPPPMGFDAGKPPAGKPPAGKPFAKPAPGEPEPKTDGGLSWAQWTTCRIIWGA